MKKINIVDILIILLIVFVLAVGYMYMSGKNIVANTEAITFNMTIEDISLETASEFNLNETVYNSVNGKPIGVIQDINVYPYEENYFDKNIGEYKKVEKIDHYTVELLIFAEVESKDSNYYSADLKIAIGTQAYLRGKNYVCTGKILGVNEVLKDEK